MDEITRAYIKVHGECPEFGNRGMPFSPYAQWHMNKEYFTSGWACCLGAQEELEIEKDVHYQQEGLTKGE